MASTVFQLTLTIIVITMTIAITTVPTHAASCNAVTTCRLGKEKFIVKTTVIPSPYYEFQNATHSTYRMEVRNHVAVKSLHDGTETVPSESTCRAAPCSIKESADVELGALLDAGEDAMVTLIAGNTRLTAHRAVLAARSPGFAALLCNGAQEGSNSEVAIPDVEGPVLRQLLAYLYTLQAPQLPSMAPQLLAAADKFGLCVLKEKCEGQVASQLSVETAAATAVLAIKHSSTTLRQAAITFIRAHLIHVMASQGWTDAVRRHPEEMVKIYRLLTTQPVQTSTPAAPASQPTTKAPSPPHTSHGQTPVATASPSPLTSAPDCSAICPFWGLSSQEKGRRLIKAAKEGRVDEVEALLAVGADMGARDSQWQGTALHWPAYLGHVEVARRLLQAGAEVDARDKLQQTPLHWAAYWGQTAVARLLIDSSANLDAREKDGRTPLHWAAERGHADIVAALLEAGADKGLWESRGKTPLDVAREHNKQHIVQLLI